MLAGLGLLLDQPLRPLGQLPDASVEPPRSTTRATTRWAISKAACQAVRGRFDPHARYIRAGVLLLGLRDAGRFTTLSGLEARQDTHHLGSVLDEAARKFGPARVGIGYGGIRGAGRGDEDTGASWTMRREMLSPRATTRWSEMAVAHAD